MYNFLGTVLTNDTLKNVLNSANLFDCALLENSVDWTLGDKNVLEECAYPCSERCDGSYRALQPRWLCFRLLAILVFLSPQVVGGCLSNLGSAEPPGLSRLSEKSQFSVFWDFETRNREGFRVGKILWSRKWQPTPVFLPGKFHGQRSLVGYSPWVIRVGHD